MRAWIVRLRICTEVHVRSFRFPLIRLLLIMEKGGRESPISIVGVWFPGDERFSGRGRCLW